MKRKAGEAAAFNRATRREKHWHRADYNPWVDQQNLNPVEGCDKGPSTTNGAAVWRGENGGNEIDEDSGFFLLLLYDEGQFELKESPSFLSFRPDKRSSFPDHQGSLRPRRDSLKEGSFPFSFPESRSPTAATHCSFPLKPVAPVLRPLYPTPLTLSFRTHVSFYPPLPFYVWNQASKIRHLSFLHVSTTRRWNCVFFDGRSLER